MRTFTATEIDLCKKIAEKDFKEITYGDYYSHGDDIGYLCDGRKLKHALDTIEVIPFWQEHDCLEWLREKNVYVRNLIESEASPDRHTWYLEVIKHAKKEDFSDFRSYQTKGKTPLEALLRVVLAVMEAK